MRIKVFIVTYRNPQALNDNLRTLFDSDIVHHNYEITIINNNSIFSLDAQFRDRVKILHNVVRPDFATGHLSRDWNCALLHGFQNLKNPDADIVVHVQDDTLFYKDWVAKILRVHTRYSFAQYGWGDNFCSYTVDAVRKIGLWDERFCGIGQQEADYFLRAIIYNREQSTINDFVHGRIHNRCDEKIIERPEHEQFDYHGASIRSSHGTNELVYLAKWGFLPNPWNVDLLKDGPKNSAIASFITYPYFERDIEDLRGKGYVVSD